MIMQSSNAPLIIKFPEEYNVESFLRLRITLWQGDTLYKLWEKEDLIIEENKVTAELTEEETAELSENRCLLEMKWLVEGNKTEMAQQVYLTISDRNDKEAMASE